MPAPLPTQTFPREATVAIIKPDAASSADAILAAAVGDGFLVIAKTSATLTKAQALELYAGTDGADAAAEHLSSGEVVVALLEKSFGIEAWLKLCGPEDAAVARDTAPQSLRAQYGSDAVKNGVHGSGSVAAAAREAAFFFGAAATALESTFALVKPSAFGVADTILAYAEAHGFSVLCSELVSVGAEKAAEFGCDAGDALAMVLMRPCAVQAWSSLCGPADAAAARASAPFSVSAQYGACHASESAEAAAKESAGFFPFLAETQTTLALVCPHAVAAGAVEPIVAAAAAAGLVITERRVASLDEGKAQDFLDLLGAATPPKAPPPAAPEPFISAWVEGGKCNKVLQLYNPSDATVDLSNYALPLIRGKGAKPDVPTSLNPFPTGKCIPPRGVFVVYHPDASAAIKAELPVDARASMPSTELSNGDDGCCLVKLGAPAAEPGAGEPMPPFTVLDCVGDFTMSNKGRPWPVAGKPSSSKNSTLVRKPTVVAGNAAAWTDPTASSQGTSEATSEWLVLKKDTLAAPGWSLTSWSATPPPPPPPPAGSYEAIVAELSSGPVVALALSAKGAVARWNAVLGPQNPLLAKVRCPTCVRSQFGVDATLFAAHGSATAAAAFKELKFFFPKALVDPLPSSKQAKDYVAETLTPTLTAGLMELCKAKPDAPVEWLAQWLMANNPNTKG